MRSIRSIIERSEPVVEPRMSKTGKTSTLVSSLTLWCPRRLVNPISSYFSLHVTHGGSILTPNGKVHPPCDLKLESCNELLSGALLRAIFHFLRVLTDNQASVCNAAIELEMRNILF